ncbi:MAG: hypothetical protein IMW91_02315 [Firmicutes bacterium]|nr:hypothetical protein [Bacillota bacterium]
MQRGPLHTILTITAIGTGAIATIRRLRMVRRSPWQQATRWLLGNR